MLLMKVKSNGIFYTEALNLLPIGGTRKSQKDKKAKDEEPKRHSAILGYYRLTSTGGLSERDCGWFIVTRNLCSSEMLPMEPG